MKRPFAVLSSLVLMLAGARAARAWDRHATLTALALKSLPSLDAPVFPETLDAYLSATGRAGGAAAFARARKINPDTTFPYQIGEKDGVALPLRAVVAGYADEPDAGMDQQLFDAYPELWKDDYLYMIGTRKGPQTRAIRHCYWPDGFFKPGPGPSDIEQDPTPLGEAPDRAQLFFDLSREAFAQGHPYWGGRFLAWSLHYVEDLSQPFHATQIPSFELLRFGPDGRLDIQDSGRAVIYYHLAVDGFPVHAGAAGLDAVLAGTDAAPVSSIRQLAVDTAKSAAKAAPALGSAALAFFPPPDASALADPAAAVYNDGFWAGLSRAPQDAAATFKSQLDEMLRTFARAARGEVIAAMSPPAQAPARGQALIPGRAVLDARALAGALR